MPNPEQPPFEPILRKDRAKAHVGFAYYQEIVLERRALVFWITGVAFLVSAVVSFMMPNRYEAQVQIMIEKRGKAEAEFFPRQSFASEEDKDYYGTQISIMEGLKVADETAEELGLRPGSFSIKAKKIPLSQVIILTAQYKDAEMAAKIANLAAKNYIREKNLQDLFLPGQILEKLPKQDNAAVTPSPPAPSAPKTAAAPDGEKKELPLVFLNKIASDSIIMNLEGQRREVETQIEEASQRYKRKHPVPISLNAKLQSIHRQTRDRKELVLSNLRTGLEGTFNISNIKILSSAEPPHSPAGPNRPKQILLSTFAAFVSSLYLVFLLEKINQKIRHEGDLEDMDSALCLGAVPFMPEIAGSRKKPAKGAATSPTSTLLDAYSKDHFLVETIAKVRTYILFSSYEKTRSVMVTSALPGEGKSTVIALLALSFGSMGRKVVLIDSDMKRPALHRYFGLKCEKGLRDYLEGNAELDEIIVDIPGTNVRLVPAGKAASNTTDLLSRERFRTLVETLLAQNDRVFIDVPPVLFISDAFILAKICQSTVFVCRAGLTQKRVLRTALEQYGNLKQQHNLVGVVINCLDFQKFKVRYNYLKDYKAYYKPVQES